jgi:hypothetical protein
MEPNRSRVLRLAFAAPLALLVFATLPAPTAQASTFALCDAPSVGVVYAGSPLCVNPTQPPAGVCTYGVWVGGTRECFSAGTCTYGVYVGATRVCEPVPAYGLCGNGYVGAYAGPVNGCQRIPSYGLCGTGYTGAYVGTTRVCEPNPTVGTCSPPTTVGATVNGIGSCQPVPIVGICYYGVVVNGMAVCTPMPTVSACDPPSSAGAKVNGVGTCQGVSVGTCDLLWTVGATVNGIGACIPVLGPVYDVLAGTSTDGDPYGSEPWLVVCADHVCHGAALDPDGGVACVDGLCVDSGDLMGLATDSDGDGQSNADEAQAHSDPTNPASRPSTDDDCDGKGNADEADFLAAQGIGHPVVSAGTGAVQVDPSGPSANVQPDVGVSPEGASSC